DALLCPTMALSAPLLEGREDDYTKLGDDGRLEGLDMTCVFNSIGQCPALTVPSGLTAAGLPTGIQIIGQRFDDAAVISIGTALEELRGWQASLDQVIARFTPQLNLQHERTK
ncbi:MAG: amidase family protein, partial [Alphaproteobacteria bacterium]